MNPQQKCALGLILEPRMAELQTKNVNFKAWLFLINIKKELYS